jgi:hypothetical protein
LKPSLFIGSSTEGSRIAEALQIELESESDPILWSQGIFQPGRAALEDLASQVERFDFAVLVLTPDDTLIKRSEVTSSPRDNLIFEAGLFIGAIGRERTFLLIPNDVTNFSLFTDYSGMTAPRYSHDRFISTGRPALGTAAAIIKERIRHLGRRREDLFERLGLTTQDIGDFYRRTSLTYAYGARREAVDRMLLDISQAAHTVRMYSRVYISELLKDTSALSSAIAQAARSAANRSNAELRIIHTSTSSRDDQLALRTWNQEDPWGVEWADLQTYQQHLKRSDALFDILGQSLAKELSPFPMESRARVRLIRNYLVDYVPPYSVVAIDDRVLYVSFYSMSTARKGSFAPTMRFLCDQNDCDTWATSFLGLVAEIDAQSSCHGRELPVL